MATEVRPYLKLRVAELEAVFEASASDPDICRDLIAELCHRKTDRAVALLARVSMATHETVAAPAPPRDTSGQKTRPLPAPQQPSERPAAPETTSAVPPIQRAPARPAPPVTNSPGAILSAWTALEALSPQTYREPADLANGDRYNVAPLDAGTLPWERGERSRPNYQLYYQIVLGSIRVDRATDELIKAFGQDEESTNKARERAALAAVLIDRQGMLVQDNAVAVSSFGWALPIALSGDLNSLGGWPDAERTLLEGLTKQLARVKDSESARPLDLATINKAFHWLVQTLGLPPDLYESPQFAVRVYHYYKSKNPPEVALLNSFYLTDLTRASTLLTQGRPGQALARFIGQQTVTPSPNLLERHDLIEALIAPEKMPPSRWPAPGGHPLVTLQQAAVNAARSELAGKGSGIVAVNGPPGTGKTTLLRDIVAACVMDRADALCKFDDPLTAFRTTGQKMSAGDRAFLHLYSLDDSLKGHEVVVASSNNKAVENVSKELPALKAVGRDISYFSTVSDALLVRGSEDGQTVEGEPSWGLIAAVLGNALNRAAFQRALWWDDDRSLRLYLKAAKGDAVVREEKDQAGNVIKRTVPLVVSAEVPPSPEQAKANWQVARKHYNTLRKDITQQLGVLETVRQACLALEPARSAKNAALSRQMAAAEAHANCERAIHRTADNCERAIQAHAIAHRQEQQVFFDRPSWWHRLFNTRRMQQWNQAHVPLVAAVAFARDRRAEATQAHERATEALREANGALQSSKQTLEAYSQKLAALESTIEAQRQRLGDSLVDENFFRRSHENWNLASPWLPKALHEQRENLFAAALALQKAFIDVTAQKVSHNIGVLMGAMHTGAFQDKEKKALLPDLWATLFLVCPVVSTTFASVARMLGDMAPESIGWIMIDEAGQATPQSAVGLLMRAKRAIVVGDPLQIPPVVSLPHRLTLEVAKYFGIDAGDWLAPEASVQTLSDQASRFRAVFGGDVAVREVGLPLLVHRRCQNPMFDISNQIAYDRQMVHAAGPAPGGRVRAVIGPSSWYDVDGAADSKWCPEEGECVVDLLRQLASAGVHQPDIYVITPFRVVAFEMRKRIAAEPDLLSSLGVDSRQWLQNRVGTIHTFQGKEAEAVIAILGAPMAAQQGARRWAASSPNIFNVMVSRAKDALYVVGSHAAWSSVGHGVAVALHLPHVGAQSPRR